MRVLSSEGLKIIPFYSFSIEVVLLLSQFV
jgi:hypothetical protein